MRKGAELISLQEALQLDRSEISDIYKQYVNPGLATMMGLINFNKKFVKAQGVNVWDDEGNEYLDSFIPPFNAQLIKQAIFSASIFTISLFLFRATLGMLITLIPDTQPLSVERTVFKAAKAA